MRLVTHGLRCRTVRLGHFLSNQCLWIFLVWWRDSPEKASLICLEDTGLVSKALIRTWEGGWNFEHLLVNYHFPCLLAFLSAALGASHPDGLGHSLQKIILQPPAALATSERRLYLVFLQPHPQKHLLPPVLRSLSVGRRGSCDVTKVVSQHLLSPAGGVASSSLLSQVPPFHLTSTLQPLLQLSVSLWVYDLEIHCSPSSGVSRGEEANGCIQPGAKTEVSHWPWQ